MKLPSKYQIDDIVSVELESSFKGRIVGVTFTENKVFYDVILDTDEIIEDIDSCFVKEKGRRWKRNLK